MGNKVVHCVWDTWTTFECSASCGGGTRKKTRTKVITEVNTKCGGTDTMYEPCNPAKCEVQCEWSSWFSGGCSRTCGGGTLTMIRHKTQVEVNTKCNGDSIKQMQCNTEECPNSTWMIVGGVGGGLFLILLVSLAFYIYWRKVVYQYWNTDEMGYHEMGEMSEIPRRVDFTEITTGNVALPNVKEFEKLDIYVEKDGSKSKMSEGRKNNQIGLNRNTDVLPFDEHRVKLRELINGRDYVNANWLSKMANDDYYDGTVDTTRKVKDYEAVNLYYEENPTYQPIDQAPNDNVTFILGEDPTEEARPHFYQMLMENFVTFVIQIKDKEEKRAPKIGTDRHIGHIKRNIKNRDQVNPNLSQTEMYIVNTKHTTNYQHMLTSFELIRQPLSGNPKDFLTAMSIIRNRFKEANGSVKAMVHDREGGIAGASVFVVLHDLLQQVDEAFAKGISDDADKLDVFKVVNEFRAYRPQMINNFFNYKFLFMCLGQYGGNKASFDLVRSKTTRKTQKCSSRLSVFSNSKKKNAKEELQKELQKEHQKVSQKRRNEYTPPPDVLINLSDEEEDQGDDHMFDDVGPEYEFD